MSTVQHESDVIPVRRTATRKSVRVETLVPSNWTPGRRVDSGVWAGSWLRGAIRTTAEDGVIPQTFAKSFGCGGPQQIVPAALLGGSVNVKTLAFLTEVPDVRCSVG